MSVRIILLTISFSQFLRSVLVGTNVNPVVLGRISASSIRIQDSCFPAISPNDGSQYYTCCRHAVRFSLGSFALLDVGASSCPRLIHIASSSCTIPLTFRKLATVTQCGHHRPIKANTHSRLITNLYCCYCQDMSEYGR